MNTLKKQLEADMQSVNKKLEELMDFPLAPPFIKVKSSLLKSRGKQLRPKLLLIASYFGTISNEQAIKYAAVIEGVHMASLVHDDVIDRSPLRRGFPTLQKEYGERTAIYAGDFLLSVIMKELAQEPSLVPLQIISEAMKQMCIGELKQYSNEYNLQVTQAEYLQAITGKTAALFEATFSLGALAGGVHKTQAATLTEIGKLIGLLFQLRDDLLDFTSQEENLGKPVFQDFPNGIYTLPVLFALAHPTTNSNLIRMAKNKKQLSNKGWEKAFISLLEDADAFTQAKAFTKPYIENLLALIHTFKSLPAQELLLQEIQPLL